jgi:hypothetical protein
MTMPRMKRERLDFHAIAPELRDLFFDWAIYGPSVRLTPALAFALETAYFAGALQTLGLAMGYPGDDVRVRCLALQRQAAERLAEIKADRDAERDRDGCDRTFSYAAKTVQRRLAKRGKDKRWK